MRITIFGTTGAGKTTLLKNLKKLLNESYVYVAETSLECPYYEQAYNDNSPNLQDLNYKLDLWMLADRMRSFKNYANNDYVIYDRSVLDSMVFAQTDHSYGRLNDVDYEVFKDYFMTCVLPNLFDKDFHNKNFDIAIYLRVSPKKAIERVVKRGRVPEFSTNKEFWYNLASSYDLWYEAYKEIVPFWVIDANNDDPIQCAKQIAEKINQFDKQKNN
ncbi:deoxynucleoside kinase [Mycoplasma leachii PG50]|uniref:Deoxynucleoside kinase n=1 Tax=Mycoplasma leachii (strain DSM 21131 / NCTC 10133 / N29 / PG50) TaxID=880447 RepID=E4PSK4_MYCLG|nr:deoxynucleoside kinase [Mycoplasma leachii]ADR24259.1 deoxynucleoside kinase [Mycoplasma leachii PG50]